MLEKFIALLLGAILLIALMAVSFLVTAGLVWVLAWVTGWFVFSMVLAFKVWVVLTILKIALKL